MKAVQRSHIAIVFSLLAIAGSFWFARLMLSNAQAQILKPAAASHQNNLINSTNGQTDGSLSYDFTDGGDRTTYSVIYLNDSGSSDVLFHSFPAPTVATDSYILNLIYNYKINKGDDGFLIEYSVSGDSACADSGSRSWETLAEATREKGKIHAREELIGADPAQVCVRVSTVATNDLDSAGYQFRDSNALGVFDIWIDTADADVQMSVVTEANAFAVGERFVYHLQASNIGSGLAEDVMAHVRLPEEVEYVSAVPTAGFYNPVSGQWEIGSIPFGESEALDVTVDLTGGKVGARAQATAAVVYMDNNESAEESHANSTSFMISDVPAGVPIILPESEPVEEEVVSRVCEVDCSQTSFFLYIVNPDGTIRDTLSDYARVTEIEPKYYIISFEDKGGDFDYDDIAFELDVRDCSNVRVTETKLNAGWHHQVKANILYGGEVKENVTIWEDSHQGIWQTKTYNLAELLDAC